MTMTSTALLMLAPWLYASRFYVVLQQLAEKLPQPKAYPQPIFVHACEHAKQRIRVTFRISLSLWSRASLRSTVGSCISVGIETRISR